DLGQRRKAGIAVIMAIGRPFLQRARQTGRQQQRTGQQRANPNLFQHPAPLAAASLGHRLGPLDNAAPASSSLAGQLIVTETRPSTPRSPSILSPLAMAKG